MTPIEDTVSRPPEPHFTAFAAHRRLITGTLADVTLAVKHASGSSVLVFDDATGRVTDVDTRGTDDEIVARLAPERVPEPPRGRGRPKLGVVPREVTLLPRHWTWLAEQPGGASVALRKLVEQAVRQSGAADRQRRARDAAYHFMSAMAGDLPGFEEASRALFAGDSARLAAEAAAWPEDVRVYSLRLLDSGGAA